MDIWKSFFKTWFLIDDNNTMVGDSRRFLIYISKRGLDKLIKDWSWFYPFYLTLLRIKVVWTNWSNMDNGLWTPYSKVFFHCFFTFCSLFLPHSLHEHSLHSFVYMSGKYEEADWFCGLSGHLFVLYQLSLVGLDRMSIGIIKQHFIFIMVEFMIVWIGNRLELNSYRCQLQALNFALVIPN